MYIIKPYSYEQAKKLGVQISPSDDPKKKIDVYDSKRNYICAVGDSRYLDYPSYLQMEKKGLVSKGYSAKRRRLYRIRHKKDMGEVGSPGGYASKLLW